MSLAIKAAEAYCLLKKAKKIRIYGKLVKEAINEDTRPGPVMKLCIRGMPEIAGKGMGTGRRFFRNKTHAKNALRYWRERRKKHGEEVLTKPDKLAAYIEAERRLAEIGISLIRRKTQSYA